MRQETPCLQGVPSQPAMAPHTGHIHPVSHRLLQRTDKEALLGQRGCVVWMTGLSGSGKSTIAIALERMLHEAGRYTVVLDGDNVRAGINSNLGFSDAARTENIRRIAEVAKLFLQNGAVVVCCFVSPTMAIREQADGGAPTVASHPDSAVAVSYRDIARKAAGRLSLRARSKSIAFPNIVVRDD